MRYLERNIKIQSQNQKEIVHDLSLSLSVLNMSRIEIAKNRRDIMDAVKCKQKCDDEIFRLKQDLSRHFHRSEQFMISYMQFYLIIDEIKTMSQNSMSYLNNLKIELNSLSVSQLSIHTSTISPLELKTILLSIQSKSPEICKLPVDHENNIWHFYKIVEMLPH